MCTREQHDQLVTEEANAIIEEAKHGCVDRGEHEGLRLGTCHAFLNHSDVCACGAIDLKKERMQ